jgi:hypothetical protein
MQKAECRRQKAEGRRQNENNDHIGMILHKTITMHSPFSLLPSPFSLARRK